MKISAQEEYGLRCLVQLANLPADESLTLPQIAEREGISVANTGKLMWLLNKAGFVQSTRGTKGGYFLARPASEITLHEVIKVLEEDEIDKHCDNYKGVLDTCVHKGDCGIRSVIVGLHEVVAHALSQVTLAQLIGSESSVEETFHQIKGINWKLERGIGLRVTPHTTTSGN
jgi:Rrf2 family iron-sulfur cluster assembly transcriptional regulator